MTQSIHTERYKKFLSLLVKARKKAGLTQIDVANRLGQHQSFVSKYETGERRLDIIEFLDVAVAIECDPIALIRKLKSNTNLLY